MLNDKAKCFSLDLPFIKTNRSEEASIMYNVNNHKIGFNSQNI
jgi:hypothetical protein